MMKTKLGILLVAIIMVVSGNIVQAQQQQKLHGPPPIPNEKQFEKMFADLSEELSLSKEQETKLSKVFKAHSKDVKTAVEQNKKYREKHFKGMEDLRADFEKKVNSLLTEEQQKQFVEFQNNHRPSKGGHPKGKVRK